MDVWERCAGVRREGAVADFRVDTSFFSHIKTKRLKRALGHDGVFALLRLWAYVADCRYSADRVLSADDVELAVDWDGEPGSLVSVFAGIGFLDAVDGGYLIHDWDEHNGFAATAGQRSAAARNAAAIRWKGQRCVDSDAGMDAAGDARKNGKACSTDAGMDARTNAAGNAHDAPAYAPALPTHANGNAPSPSPSPSPLQKKKALCDGAGGAAGQRQGAAPDGAVGARPALVPKSMKAETFDLFWAAFADKRGRAPAWKAWCRIPRLDLVLAEAIVQAAMVYAAARPALVERGGTPKMAEGWLTDRRWEDEAPAVAGGGAPMRGDVAAAFASLGVGDE